MILQWSRCVLKSPWLCRLGDASYVMCTALYMMVLYDRARVGPSTKISNEISIICLFRLILQANPLFCFELWYSSSFNVKCLILYLPQMVFSYSNANTNPSRSSSLSCQSFSLMCFSSSGSDHFNISKIKYQFFSTLVVFIHPKLPLFFPPSHPCFFKDPDFLFKYPFY